MAKDSKGYAYATGRDAAYIEPKFVPDDALLPRDNSGGIDFTPHTAQFGDGGEVNGAKSYLSASGGTDTAGTAGGKRMKMSRKD